MTTRTLVSRLALPGSGGRRAIHLMERNARVAKTFWTVILSGFFEPIFYLFAIGVGIGQLTGDLALPDGTEITYAAFVAPALLAASAMNGAAIESTFVIFFTMKYGRIYDAILATPVEPREVALGEIGWSLTRGGIYSTAFFVVMAAMGLVLSPWGLLAVPAALLIGFAFAAVGMAATTYMRTWQDLDLVTLVLLPLFLFSATFYPIEVYPAFFQALTQLSPLYHGVVLIRSLTLGQVGPELLWHAGFLAVMGLIGAGIAARRISSLLLA